MIFLVLPFLFYGCYFDVSLWVFMFLAIGVVFFNPFFFMFCSNCRCCLFVLIYFSLDHLFLDSLFLVTGSINKIFLFIEKKVDPSYS